MIVYKSVTNEFLFDETVVTPDVVEVTIEQYSALIGRDIESGPSGLPQLTMAALKSSIKEQITAKRWEVETGGITLPNGVPVKTDISDQNRITSVITNAPLAGVTSVKFKSDGDVWTTMSIDDVKYVAHAISWHVQACFAAECDHHMAVDALIDRAEIAEYDFTVNWPGPEELARALGGDDGNGV